MELIDMESEKIHSFISMHTNTFRDVKRFLAKTKSPRFSKEIHVAFGAFVSSEFYLVDGL